MFLYRQGLATVRAELEGSFDTFATDWTEGDHAAAKKGGQESDDTSQSTSCKEPQRVCACMWRPQVNLGGCALGTTHLVF